MKQAADGLNDRERAFVRERRADPAANAAEIAKRAGYEGSVPKLTERARQLMRKPAVAMAVIAPVRPDEIKPQSDEDLKADIKLRLLAILRSTSTTDSDKIKAADKLLSTIPGGYVPIQVKQTGTFTLESWVAQMGGRPEEDLPILPEKEIT